MLAFCSINRRRPYHLYLFSLISLQNYVVYLIRANFLMFILPKRLLFVKKKLEWQTFVSENRCLGNT